MTLYCPECNANYEDNAMRNCPDDGSRLYQVENEEKDPLVGSVIDGRFRIDSVLGEGGMGIVYKAQQLSVNRDVAVKVLRADLSHKQVALERFFREAKTISNLSHPNIVRLIDFGQDRKLDLLYLVMELVQGFNLGDLIAEGRLRTTIALDVLYQACGALTEPHAADIVHRDLKPDNILLVPMSDGTIQTKVLDFGIARALEQNTQLTATGMICGTPAYMAPEQAQNEAIDARADLYSLGVIFYEMVSGWPPFSGTSSLQIMLKHIQENPIPLRDLVPPGTVIPPIEALVDDLLNKGREDRPATARALRIRIDAVRRDLGIDPIRVEPDMTFREVVDAWLLPKLPKSSGVKSGPTEVFRRETGMEHWLTQEDKDLADSAPTLPDSRDERVKVVTQKGAQQAWTPSAQSAVQRIKDTNDAPLARQIDAHGKTEAALQPRRTMVEEGLSDSSEEGLASDSSPDHFTGESRPVTPKPRAAHTGPRPAEQPSPQPRHDSTQESRRPTKPQNQPLLFVAILLGLAAIGGTIALAYLLTRPHEGLKTKQIGQVADVVIQPIAPIAPKAATNPALPAVTELALRRVENATEDAKTASSAVKKAAKRPKRVTNAPKITKAPPVKPEPASNPEPAKTTNDTPSYQELFGKGRLRSE